MKYLNRYFANRFWCNINTEPIASDKEQLAVPTFYQNFFTRPSSFILYTDSLSKLRFTNSGVTQASHLGTRHCCPLRIHVNSALPFLRNCHALAELWSKIYIYSLFCFLPSARVWGSKRGKPTHRMKIRLSFRSPIQIQGNKAHKTAVNAPPIWTYKTWHCTSQKAPDPSTDDASKGQWSSKSASTASLTCGRTAALRSSVLACFPIAGRTWSCVYFCFLLSSGVPWNSAYRKAQLGIHLKRLFWNLPAPSSLSPKEFLHNTKGIGM